MSAAAARQKIDPAPDSPRGNRPAFPMGLGQIVVVLGHAQIVISLRVRKAFRWLDQKLTPGQKDAISGLEPIPHQRRHQTRAVRPQIQNDVCFRKIRNIGVAQQIIARPFGDGQRWAFPVPNGQGNVVSV